MKDTYTDIMRNKFKVDFNMDIKKDSIHYIKENKNTIIIYQWEDGFVYRAPFKCIASSTRTLEEVCMQVESKCKVKSKHKEYNLFAQQITLPQVEGIEIRELTLQEEAILEEMQSECPLEDTNMAEIKIYDIHILGAFIKGKLVGVSSVGNLWGAYDIGVLVHPQYRKQKVSSCLVAHNASWILSQNKVCMYRCEADNLGSYKTACNVGFQKEVDVVIYELEDGVKK